MLKGNTKGYISRDLGGADPRPPMSNDERQRLMEFCQAHSSQTFPSNDSSTEQLPESIQSIFNDGFSAKVDGLKDAAVFLGLDLDNLRPDLTIQVSPQSVLRLRVDQVQNVAFMVKQGEGILRGCINGNDCGTGKTVETLAAVYFMATRKARDPHAEHKPVIILCPPIAVGSWRSDYCRFFKRLLTLGDASLLSTEDIIGQVQAMSPGDPSTSRRVFLFTFASFAKTFLSRLPNHVVLRKTLSNPRSKLTDEQVEALRSSEKEILFSLDPRMGPGKFGTCVVDEAHEIKHPKSNKAQAQYLIKADVNFLLTATPTNNRISDLRGLLFALFKPDEWQLNWPRRWEPGEIIRVTFADDFNVFKVPQAGCTSLVPDSASPAYRAALANGQHLWRLNPALYRWLGHHWSFEGKFSRRVHGAIMSLCLLHRSADSTLELPDGRSILVSDVLSIPRTMITTVEVGMSSAEQDSYNELASLWFPHIYFGDTRNVKTPALLTSRNELPRAGFNKTIDWRLSVMTTDINLAQITRFRSVVDSFNLGDRQLDFDSIAGENQDLGVSFYHKVTREEADPKEPPVTRLDMIHYMLKKSAKMRWLLPKLWEWKKEGRKATVFCCNELTQWFIERICLLVGRFNFLSLSAKHSQKIRAEAIADFNTPGRNNNFDFLLTTMNAAGTSVELQGNCNKMVIFELPGNFSAVLNAIGRIHRFGQRRPQDVVILTLAKSYDDFVLARAFRKYVVEVCGKEGFVRLARRFRFRRIDLQLRRRKGITLRKVLAGELLRRTFRMRWNRLGVPFCKTTSLRAYAGERYEKVTELGKALLKRVVPKEDQAIDEALGEDPQREDSDEQRAEGASAQGGGVQGDDVEAEHLEEELVRDFQDFVGEDSGEEPNDQLDSLTDGEGEDGDSEIPDQDGADTEPED